MQEAREYQRVWLDWNLSYDLSLISEEDVKELHSWLKRGYVLCEVIPDKYNSDGRLEIMELSYTYDLEAEGKEYVVSLVTDPFLSNSTHGRSLAYKAIRYFDKTFPKEFEYYPCSSVAVPPWAVKGYKFIGMVPFAFGARGSLIASVAIYEKGEDVKML